MAIEAPRSTSRILLIDDEEANLKLLVAVLRRAGYSQFATVSDSRNAARAFDDLQPEIVLLDLRMPHVDGFEVLKSLNARLPPEAFVPIVVLTGDGTQETKIRALAAGAIDFLLKPIDSAEVVARVGNLLRTRSLHDQVVAQKRTLEERVAERTSQLDATKAEVVRRLGLACEYRDDDTGMHAQRVGEMSAAIAAELGLEPEFVELLRQAAPLHDIGKVGIPDSILLKTAKLTPQEWNVIKTHTAIGAKILSGSPHRLLNLAEEIAFYHHERYDGKGYEGVPGDQVPISGRIVAVADVFDALTHERPYKRAWTREAAVEELQAKRGTQFHPEVIDAFLASVAL